MSDKLIVLINGANQGIGYYAAKQLAATGQYHVLIGSRDISKGQKAVKDLVADSTKAAEKANVEAVQLDCLSDESIYAAAETIDKKFGRLDVLVNNAAIGSGSGSLRDQYKAIFDTNFFGHAVVTEAFLPLLRKSSKPGEKRMIYVSSGMSSVATVPELNKQLPAVKELPQYRTSKTAQNMLMAHYADLLEPEGFTVGSVCPGLNSTNLNGYVEGGTHPSHGATMIVRAIEGEAKDFHAKHSHHNGVYPW